MKNKIFKGMEFIFKQVDTSKVTGKTYLPIFINEVLYDVYGDTTIKKVKEINKIIKPLDLMEIQQILAFVKDLYSDYNIYDNHLTFFRQSLPARFLEQGLMSIIIYCVIVH